MKRSAEAHPDITGLLLMAMPMPQKSFSYLFLHIIPLCADELKGQPVLSRPGPLPPGENGGLSPKVEDCPLTRKQENRPLKLRTVPQPKNEELSPEKRTVPEKACSYF
jgi:hypothetical protein